MNNTYNYDSYGNRTSRISATGTDIYHYDDADKLTSVDRPSGTTTYTYDNCGRPTNIWSRVLTWDYEDRMTSYSGYSQNANYGYNGVGSRVTKSGTGGARTYKRDGVGVTAPVLADGVATMVPGISEKSGGVTSTILPDRMGSMKGMSNAGTVTETAEFDAFGKVIARTNPSATQKGFAGGFGYQEDGETGYKLLGHRYYDADTGRFLSRDRAFDGKNWYRYCNNNPLKYVDPNGKEVFLIAAAVVGLAGLLYFGWKHLGPNGTAAKNRARKIKEAQKAQDDLEKEVETSIAPTTEPDQAQANRLRDGVKDAGEAWKDGVDDAYIEPAVGSAGVVVEVFVGIDASGRDILNEINKSLGKDPNYFDRWYHKDRIKPDLNPGNRSVKLNGITGI